MTNKEIAAQLRSIQADNFQNAADRIIALADELDPPRPEPGAVVWFRWDDTDWEPGIVFDKNAIVDKNSELVSFDDIQYKPAHVLGPRQVTATIPDVSEWPEDSGYCEVCITFDNHYGVKRVQRVIHRAEAECMGGNND